MDATPSYKLDREGLHYFFLGAQYRKRGETTFALNKTAQSFSVYLS